MLIDILKEEFDNNQVFAHLKENDNGDIIYETLFEHSIRSYETTLYILETLGLEKTFYSVEPIKNAFNKILIKSILFSSSLHDYGKQNYYFQIEKMRNEKFTNNDFLDIKFEVLNSSKYEAISDTKTSNHSRFNILSHKPEIFHNYISEEILLFFDVFDINLISGRNIKKKEKEFLNELTYLFKFLTESHHDGIKESLNINKLKVFQLVYGELDSLFIVEILHSILVNADVISTKYFIDEDTNKVSVIDYCDKVFNNISNNKTSGLMESLETKQGYNNNLFKSLNENDELHFDVALSNLSNINELKNLFASSIVKSIRGSDVHMNKFLFLEGEVGIGKTNTSFIIAHELLKRDINKKKIIYVAPLNHLLFQTKDELLNNTDFGEENINIINSIERDKVKNSSNIEDSYFYENFNKNFILTSSVNFFEKLYHKGKKDISHLIYLKDSIIFIDELQLLNDNFFDISYKYLELLTKYLDCQVIIMSATIPMKKYTMNLTLNNEVKYIVNKEYLDKINLHDYLKRSSYNLDFFDSKNDYSKQKALEYLLSKEENRSILIVHNSITKLNKFKKSVEDVIPDDYEVRFYHNNILKPINDKTLDIVKEGKKKIIVFATKKIETGVDVSFQQGLKFIDAIDNISQFGGRINRYGQYKNSEILILQDDEIYFSDQERERITKLYATTKSIVKEFVGNIDKYYYEVFEKHERDDTFIYNLSKSDIASLNNLKLISEYIKENFIVEIDFHKNNSFLELLPDSARGFIEKYKITSSIQLFDRSKPYFYDFEIKEIQLNFKISGYINRKSNFGKELSNLKEINISLSHKYVDLYKVLDEDNFYYDLLSGIDFNKDIETEEILDTFNI